MHNLNDLEEKLAMLSANLLVKQTETKFGIAYGLDMNEAIYIIKELFDVELDPERLMDLERTYVKELRKG